MLDSRTSTRPAPSGTMKSLLAPIIAQLLTAGAGARTEVRDVVEIGGVQHLEGAASAGVGVNLNLPYLSIAVGYSPSVTVDPLESTPREVIVTDTVFASARASHTFRFRRSSLTLSQTAGYTVQNPVLQALSGPPPARAQLPPLGGDTGGGNGAPDGPEPPPDGSEAADLRRAEDYRVQTWNLYSSIEYERQISRPTTFSATAGYSFGAGFGIARETNPLVQGPDARIELGHELTRRDDLTTLLVGQYRWSELGNHGQIVLLGERWAHDFSRRTRSEVGAGITYSREWTGDGAVLNGIYPAGTASISNTSRFASGMLTLGAGATAAPFLDVTSATVDPRLGVGGNASWTRRRWTLSALISSAISFSTEPDAPGALNSLFASATAVYDLRGGFFLDFGARSAWQEFEGVTVVNPESAIFVGLGWSGAVTLIEGRRLTR